MVGASARDRPCTINTIGFGIAVYEFVTIAISTRPVSSMNRSLTSVRSVSWPWYLLNTNRGLAYTRCRFLPGFDRTERSPNLPSSPPTFCLELQVPLPVNSMAKVRRQRNYAEFVEELSNAADMEDMVCTHNANIYPGFTLETFQDNSQLILQRS